MELFSPEPAALSTLAEALAGRRVVVVAGPKLDRRPFVEALQGDLLARSAPLWRLSADLGSPTLGPPGAASLRRFCQGEEGPLALAALATLDSARFRLPLAEAAAGLASTVPGGKTLLVEAPCVTRGAARDELVSALARLCACEALVLLWPAGNDHAELLELLSPPGLERYQVRVEDQQAWRAPSKSARRAGRDQAWATYLGEPRPLVLPAEIPQRGRPRPAGWAGRIVGLLSEGGRTIGLGVCRDAVDGELLVDLPAHLDPSDVAGRCKGLLLRDLLSSPQGALSSETTAEQAPRTVERPAFQLRPRAEEVVDLGPPTTTRSAGLQVTLVSGIFGDPLVHLRRPKDKRSLLCDLGETQRLPARLAHQVSDVLISHAHVDHVAGFLWFVRSRIGHGAPCRAYGPPGIAAQLAHMLGGITWNLLEGRGPSFEVRELHGEILRCFSVAAGAPSATPLGEAPCSSGQMHEDEVLRIRAVELDHLIPVLAYAVEDRRSGERLVYATDFGDTEANRTRLAPLVEGAHTLICEASFREGDAHLAASCRHLTTKACAHIARGGDVKQLLPFHFSRRYEREPEELYREIAAIFPRVAIPQRIRARLR